jgi:hypothetical protein
VTDDVTVGVETGVPALEGEMDVDDDGEEDVLGLIVGLEEVDLVGVTVPPADGDTLALLLGLRDKDGLEPGDLEVDGDPASEGDADEDGDTLADEVTERLAETDWLAEILDEDDGVFVMERAGVNKEETVPLEEILGETGVAVTEGEGEAAIH